MHPAQGSVLGGTYRLERVIGTGGMGTVYEATHVRLPRRFAVKLLLPEIAAKRELFERFKREAEIASAAGHENIVEAYDFNISEDGTPYIVMELLLGESLRTRLDGTRQLSVRQTVGIVSQVSSALSAAHVRGIVHRDLKPDNIFLCRRAEREELVKVLDFGVSKLMHSQTVSTESGALIGTPHYMAPEQASGSIGLIDPRTDIFALGAIAYECLAGDFAFQGPTPVGVIYGVVHATPRPLRELREDVSEALDQVIARALSKRPQDRQQDAEQLRSELVQAAGSAVETLPSGVPLKSGGVSSSAPTVAAGRTPEIVIVQPTNQAEELHTRLSASAASSEGKRASAGRSSGVETLGQASVETLAREARATPRSFRRLVMTGVLLVAAVAAVLWFRRSADGPSVSNADLAPAAGLQPEPERQVELRLRVEPASARVEIDGVSTRETVLRLPRSEQLHELVANAPGYRQERRSFRALTDGELIVELKPEPTPVTAPSSAGRSAPAPLSRGASTKAQAPKSPAPEERPKSPEPPPPAKPAALGPVERSL